HRHNEKDSTWERGAKITEGMQGDDVWDDVLEPGADSNEMDLSSMAEAAEKFRREMDAMREELKGPTIDPDEIKDDLDAFDKKLEDAAAAGQFDDSDNEEVQWDEVSPEQQHNANANGPLEDHTANLLGRQSSGSHLFDSLEPAGEQLVLEEKSNFSLPQMPVEEGFTGLSSLHMDVEDEWFYLDPQGLQQGPFKTAEMREWFEAGYFKPHLPIRFGREGIFTALANQFVHGQMPFAAPPTRMSDLGGMRGDLRQNEQQRLLEMQREQQRLQQQQQQQQQMMQLQQQQQQQRMLQLNQEEKIRMEMQRLEIARQQQQTQLYQQQQMLQHQQQQQRQQQQQQQQQQQMLLQQQSSWQRSQREGIMSALGIFGGNQDTNITASDKFRSDSMQIQFQSDYRTQHQLNMQNPQPLGQDTMILNDEVQRRDQAFWPSAGPEMAGLESATSSSSGLQSARPTSPMAPETTASRSPTAVPVVDAWGARPQSPEHSSPTLRDIQNDEKRRAAHETRKNDDQIDSQQEQRKEESPIRSTKKEIKAGEDSAKKTSPSPAKKNGKKGENIKTETNAWATSGALPAASTNSKSLKDIQQEEQREMLNKMSNDNDSNANLAQMGAQLKIMLGVDSIAVAQTTPSVPVPPTQQDPVAQPTPTPTPAPTPAPVASPWGTPAAVTKSSTSKSMRDILAEEERLAQERAKSNENAPTSSHWMNIVAGNKVAAAAIPKPSRSVLGPVPASVLKSRQQVRTANGAAKPSPPKTETDASFWNFGAAQPGKEPGSAPVSNSNAFGSNNVSSEFMTWALKQLKMIDSNANVTLLEYCASVEDPGEIREYLAAYLGSTPRVSAFATEFIQRKKTQHSGKKSPGRQDAEQRASETGSSNKRGKRRSKGQKVDPSLLNYSVGS
ncbi:Hypothetical protein PHPALM_12603, partial [Phytophthora palmivora]